MTTVIINPGTGRIDGGTPEDANRSTLELLHQVAGGGRHQVAIISGPGDRDLHGWYPFEVAVDDQRYELNMPGLPPDRMQLESLDTPRVYIDGSSWIWEIAVQILASGPEKGLDE